ncbi:hypothetical protein MHSWG343_04850 [Candidatus Mycoplasma haematohominis]|uniref:Uncharacterized protein n=1 Tax=Candidatus Mycoplasma haematohominis TaxID=1494318 RepID=A0A478FPS3_9MOLU|nr:hypothetical protein MHSWG343_04850 [Candidatus Mycoplasma haemohominis]
MTPQAAAGIGVGAIAVGGTGIGAYMLANNSSYPITLEVFLQGKEISDDNKTNYTGEGKLGSEVQNRKLLVAGVEENKDWWNKRYEKSKEKSGAKLDGAKSAAFKEVTSGYGTDEHTSLNKVCDSHYKKPKTEFKGDATGATLKADLKLDVEKFCTLNGNGSLIV